MMNITRYWSELDPKKKRIIVIALFIFGLIFFVSVFTGSPEKSRDNKNRQDVIRHVLTDQNTREVGIDSLSADVKKVVSDNALLRKEIERLTIENEKISRENQTKTAEMQSQLKLFDEKLRDLNNKEIQIPSSSKNNEIKSGTGIDITSQRSRVESNERLDYKDPLSFFENAPIPKESSYTGSNNSKSTPSQELKIVSISQPVKTESDSVKDDNVAYLPSGSILTGTFINGMDAPTSQGSRRDPFPSTLRIQKEAILPNRFSLDIKECFLIVSGYGDLSSERAYLRGETLSCIREDGGVIESKLDSYVVGEDGKAGVRGIVVSKQGQIIAKSLMAGFLSGLSDAFDVKPIPVLNTTNVGGKTEYQSVYSADMLQGAAAKGASKALDRIAQFYLDMAEGIFPVIEIDAGRQVDIIVTKGIRLQFKSVNEGNKR